ncbi:MAG: MarR family transcriptional regulator [Candidatus Bathyarchaeia archaeon]
MFDLFLLASIILSAVIVIVSAAYYKQINGLRKRYEEARDVVGDIVLSFNSQLKGYKERLDDLSHKAAEFSPMNERVANIIKEHEGQLKRVVSRIDILSESSEEIKAQILDTNRRLDSLVTTQEKISEKVAEVETLGKRLSVTPQAESAKIEAPIPIKREKALAPLTETELRVLKSLAGDGSKTAPEIRDEIKLTREHTARLMKKLYEEGYLERSTRKIPYTYRIKKEMMKILEKQA